MEISQASIENSTVETKTKLTDDLFRLLQVREKNADMAKDWLLYLTTSKFNRLTPGEVYEAFKMAISRELLDSKEREIDILPELSNNTTGKVLSAYLKYKAGDVLYNAAKTKLKQLARPDITEATDEQKKGIRERFLKTVYDELVNINNKAWRKANADKPLHSADAWLLYDDLQEKLAITNAAKKRLYNRQERKYAAELEREVSASGNKVYHRQLLDGYQKRTAAGTKNTVVQNRCKSIVVSNFLKAYLTSFETFKNVINN